MRSATCSYALRFATAQPCHMWCLFVARCHAQGSTDEKEDLEREKERARFAHYCGGAMRKERHVTVDAQNAWRWEEEVGPDEDVEQTTWKWKGE